MKTILSTKIEKKVLQGIKNYAYCNGLKMQSVVEHILAEFLEKEKENDTESSKKR